MSEYSTAIAGAIAIAPAFPGTVLWKELRGAGDDLLLAAGSFLVCGPGVTLTTEYGGGRSWFSGTGPFILRATGSGPVFFNTYGAVIERDVQGALTVDTGHLVAWEPSLSYRITRARKIRSFLFSDQLLLSFSGRGRVWINSRSPQSLASWVHPFRRVTSKSSGDDLGGE